MPRSRLIKYAPLRLWLAQYSRPSSLAMGNNKPLTFTHSPLTPELRHIFTSDCQSDFIVFPICPHIRRSNWLNRSGSHMKLQGGFSEPGMGIFHQRFPLCDPSLRYCSSSSLCDYSKPQTDILSSPNHHFSGNSSGSSSDCGLRTSHQISRIII